MNEQNEPKDPTQSIDFPPYNPILKMDKTETRAVTIEFEELGSDNKHTLQLLQWANGDGAEAFFFDGDTNAERHLGGLSWAQFYALKHAFQMLEDPQQ